MWPMSNALYPGLQSPTDGRPQTADTELSWYTYGSRGYSASNYSRSRRNSGRRSARTGRTGETEGGEDLRDLLRRSQRALTVLTDSDDDEGPAHQSAPEYDGDSVMTPYTPHGQAWKGPIWRSLSRRTAMTGVTTASKAESPGAERRRGSAGASTSANLRTRHTMRSKRIPSVASRMETEEPIPDPVPAYQEIDFQPQLTSPPTSREGIEMHPTFSHQPETEFQTRLSRLTETSPPSVSSLSFTNMGNNGAGIAFSKIDYDAPGSAPSAAKGYMSPLGATALPIHDDLGPEVRPVSPLLGPEDMRSQMQPRVVTFSNFDEVAMDCSTDQDSRSVTNRTIDSWERFDPEQEKKPDIVQEVELPEPEPTQYLYGLPLIAVTSALSLTVFLVAMDVNVIATAVPHITADFNSLDDVGWYGSAFLMTTCAFQILFGRIYTIYPAKFIFLGSIGIFMCGSLACALSPISTVFVIGRAIQGIGTSGILSGGLIIISQVVPLQTRSVLGGVIGAMEGVAMICAPIIGGALTDKLNWRWCFYINLPIGGCVLLVVFFFLVIPEANRPQKAADRTWWETCYQLDLIGAALLVPPIVCLLLGLQYGGTLYPWNSIGVILLFVLALVLTLAFAYSQYVNGDVAMIPFHIIKQRSVLAGFWYILCTSSALVVMTYFLPIWFQTIQGSTPTQSGLHLLPMLIGVIVGVVAAGILVSVLGYYTPFMILGSICMSVGVGLLTTIVPDSGTGVLIAFPAVFGFGVGIGFQQPLIGAQAVLSKEDIPVGTSIIVFGQTIGAAIVLSIAESVFQNRLQANIQSYLNIPVTDPHALMQEGTAALAATLTPDQQPLLVMAANKALTQTFYVAMIIAALSMVGSAFMEWKSVKPPPEADAGAKAEAGVEAKVEAGV